jgi:hypothetical protein
MSKKKKNHLGDGRGADVGGDDGTAFLVLDHLQNVLHVLVRGVERRRERPDFEEDDSGTVFFFFFFFFF